MVFTGDVSANETCEIIPPLCLDSHLESIGYLYIHMPIAIIGIITNTLNLLVLHHHQFRSRVTAFTLLRAMAVADLLACVTIFPIGLCRCLDPGDGIWQTYIQQFYEIYIYLPISNWFGCVSVWLTTVVSFERYFCVAHPLKAKYMWTSQVAHWLIVSIFLAGLALYLPYFFLRQIEDHPPPGYTEWGMSAGAEVYSWIRMVLAKTVPIFAVAILNGRLLTSIGRLNKRRKTMIQPTGGPPKANERRSQLQMRATAMVVSISIMFLLCHSVEPFSHSGLYSSLFGMCQVYTRNHRILLLTTNIAEVTSYASNFFFYCLFNKQFRGVLKQFCCCSSSAPSSISGQQTTPPLKTSPMALDSVM